jgi:hypothetical protein
MTAPTVADCGKSEAELLALPLAHGSHGNHFDGECCLVEKSNRIATCIPAFCERYGAAPFADDHPSVSRVVRAMAIGLNDMRWPSDVERTAALDRFTIAILGTRTTDGDEVTRSYMACDWLIRVYTPAWLRLAGLTAEAQALESLARVADAATVTASRPAIDSARKSADAAGAAAGAAARAAAWDAAWAAARAAAWDAAWAAAWDAARAAAWDAAGAAARAAAWDAAWAAARAAAWDAAWAAAGDAARDAARAAAGAAAWDAARAAAGAAARDALAPTALALRVSAIELLDAMIMVGKRDEVAA